MHNLQLKEAATHGTKLLPLSYYPLHLSKSFCLVSLHWHEEMEITWIESGSGNYQIGGEAFTVEAGDIIIVNPQVLHRIEQNGDVEMTSHTFVFHINLLNNVGIDTCSVNFFQPLLNHKHQFPNRIQKVETSYNQILACFHKLLDCHNEKKVGYELLLKGYLFEIIGILYGENMVRQEEEIGTNMEAMEKIKKVLNYIHEHYERTITISELANLLHFSDYYFMKYFKRYAGMTCIAYINEYRLSKAAELLKQGELSVTEIALQVGYNNISYFIRAYKKQYGVTPSGR